MAKPAHSEQRHEKLSAVPQEFEAIQGKNKMSDDCGCDNNCGNRRFVPPNIDPHEKGRYSEISSF